MKFVGEFIGQVHLVPCLIYPVSLYFLPSLPHSLSFASLSLHILQLCHSFSRPSFIIIPSLFLWPLPTSWPVSLHYHVCLHCFIVFRLYLCRSLSLYPSTFGLFFGRKQALRFLQTASSNSSQRWFITPAVICLCALFVCVCRTAHVTERAR